MGQKLNKRRKLVRSKEFLTGGKCGAATAAAGACGGTNIGGILDADGFDGTDAWDYGYGGGSSWRGAGTTYNAGNYNYKPHPKHTGDKPIKVGKFEIYAGAMRDLTAADIDEFDVLIPLTQDIPNFTFGHPYRILAAPLVDYGGVPANWEVFLKELVIPLLEGGHKMLAYCFGSHGRTGCFLASLISILEPETEDPIAAVRERHCKKAVESLAQAKAVFALRGQELPKKYDKGFERSYATNWQGAGYGTYGGYTAPATTPVDPLPTTGTGIVGKTLHDVAKMTDAEWAAYAKENSIPLFD